MVQVVRTHAIKVRQDTITAVVTLPVFYFGWKLLDLVFA